MSHLQPHARSDADGFTLVELVTTVAIIGILAVLTVPALTRARMSANETSAIGTLQAINSAEAAYASAAGSGGYATDLTVLAAHCPGQSNGFISPELATVPLTKSGYAFTLAPGSAGPGPNDCNGTATREGYYLTAAPVSDNVSGRRGFATSSGHVIFVDLSGTPPSEAALAPGGGGTPIQ